MITALSTWIKSSRTKQELWERLKNSLTFFPMAGPVRMAWNTIRLWRNKDEVTVDKEELRRIKGKKRTNPTYAEDKEEERIEIDEYRQNQQARKALVESILVEAGSHGVREAFLESFPQLVTQALIICSTGNISIS